LRAAAFIGVAAAPCSDVREVRAVRDVSEAAKSRPVPMEPPNRDESAPAPCSAAAANGIGVTFAVDNALRPVFCGEIMAAPPAVRVVIAPRPGLRASGAKPPCPLVRPVDAGAPMVRPVRAVPAEAVASVVVAPPSRDVAGCFTRCVVRHSDAHVGALEAGAADPGVPRCLAGDARRSGPTAKRGGAASGSGDGEPRYVDIGSSTSGDGDGNGAAPAAEPRGGESRPGLRPPPVAAVEPTALAATAAAAVKPGEPTAAPTSPSPSSAPAVMVGIAVASVPAVAAPALVADATACIVAVCPLL